MSMLLLPDGPDVPWARLVQGAGEGGSYAFQIDGSGTGTRNRMMYRVLLPNGGSPSMKTRIRLKSTMTVGNRAFEGLAVRHRGYKLEGDVPAQKDKLVWDSDPETKGVRAWYSQQSSTFTDAVFIEPVPESLGIDYITFELILRAGGGVTLSNAECRNHYAVPYHMDIMGWQLWTSGFSIEAVAPGIGGSEGARRWVKYVRTERVNIRKGKLCSTHLRCTVTGRAWEAIIADSSSARRLAADVGIMLKLRRTDEPNMYDYFTAAKAPVSVDHKTQLLDGSNEFNAPRDYSQVEVLVFTEPSQVSAGYDRKGVDRMGFQDMELTFIVADYIAPSQ